MLIFSHGQTYLGEIKLHKKLETACGFHQQCNVVIHLTLTFIAVTAKLV